jgi:TonB family protein
MLTIAKDLSRIHPQSIRRPLHEADDDADPPQSPRPAGSRDPCTSAAGLCPVGRHAHRHPALAQSDWSRQVARIISSKQTYPATAQMRGEEGTAKVKVYVGADGSVQRTELATGSGSPCLTARRWPCRPAPVACPRLRVAPPC